MTLQKKATLISSSVAATLTLIKLIIGIFSGSVAVLASAIDSILDMFVSVFNYFAISNAEKPADKVFNYGRGKIEALASVIEGTIITLSGIFLLYKAIKKYFTNQNSQYLEISLIVMIISLVITLGLVTYLNYVSKKTNNMVIKADALHYKTDVYSNIAVLGSLILVKLTNYEIIDVIVGASIAIFIIYSAYSLISDGVLILLDRAVEEEIVNKIKNIINSNEKITTYHLLKTREAANETFVDVHLVFDYEISLINAHKISDKIEDKIRNIDKTKDWVINIHLDPYDDSKTNIENNNF
ncbi:cation-efflux pump [Malaciobacter molluscorum LMG 25693]|uniref:Cation-efflux pump n=1 Tax=Malaciobacter molluscorum LMG 25693 TaxID=870501 RepID=A0A2G1DLD8_9BACT|nr:cation diffusion facilitator family transporter [Malaciobacter molluscorum]AXX92742.1 divalent metal cation transporter (ZT_dimer domain) [Malaciobacter molluscorum LMG 25693]PHO19156.1 cation-efflux pump [Malaciobacter molluscorum LMG 25693]